MLGIRHFKGSAIDLYLGDITEFCSDVIVTACNPDLSPKSKQDKSILSTSSKSSFEFSKDTKFKHILDAETGHLPCSKLALIKSEDFEVNFKESIHNSLNYVREFNLRHVSFPIWSNEKSINESAKVFFNTIKEYLSVNDGSELRITVVLDSREDYFSFQDEMFEIFPEESK
jgi:O-acetyl-ADP-ribose deacetylase (regulator of RNase III)